MFLADTARAFPIKPDRPIGAGIANASAAVAAAVAGQSPTPVPVRLDTSYPILDNVAIEGQTRHFTLELPENFSRVTFRSFGGTGDPDLYVRKDAPASTTTFDAKSVRPGTNSVVVLNAPAAGTYHVALHGTKAYAGVHVSVLVE